MGGASLQQWHGQVFSTCRQFLSGTAKHAKHSFDRTTQKFGPATFFIVFLDNKSILSNLCQRSIILIYNIIDERSERSIE